jgi:hypothetical protein
VELRHQHPKHKLFGLKVCANVENTIVRMRRSGNNSASNLINEERRSQLRLPADCARCQWKVLLEGRERRAGAVTTSTSGRSKTDRVRPCLVPRFSPRSRWTVPVSANLSRIASVSCPTAGAGQSASSLSAAILGVRAAKTAPTPSVSELGHRRHHQPAVGCAITTDGTLSGRGVPPSRPYSTYLESVGRRSTAKG